MDEIVNKINENIAQIRSELDDYAILEKRIASKSFEDVVISWSKSRAYSLMPFYCELTGFQTDVMLTKEPKNKKNVYCYLGGAGIDRIISFNSKGGVESEEYILNYENYKIGIVKDFRGDFRSITKLYFDNDGRYTECYSVTDDDDFFGYHYIYNDGRISEAIAITSNGLKPYVRLYFGYANDGCLDSVYFKSDAKPVYIFNRN